MGRLHRSLLAAALALGVASAASAATLDFTAYPAGFQGTTVLNLPEATVTSLADDLYRGAGGIPDSICSISGGICTGDMRIEFTTDVSNLSFVAGGFAPGDFVAVSAFDGNNDLLGSIDIAAEGAFGFGALGGIRALFFADSSSAAGLTFGDFSFDQEDGGTGVPLPATLPLLFAGLVGRRLIARTREVPASFRTQGDRSIA